MRINVSEIVSLYQPSAYGFCLHLRQCGEEEAPPRPYDQVLQRLGERHEAGLQVHNGQGEVVAVPCDGGSAPGLPRESS